VPIRSVWKKLASAEDTLRLSSLLAKIFGVSAALEEGACLEATYGTRHPIQGSCSIRRNAANTIVLESPKVSRRHALIHLQNES